MIDGTAIVDRVEIKQEKSALSITNYREVCSLIQSNSSQRELERRLLEELTPKNSTLVLQDSFADDFVDQTKWKTLGKVNVIDGQLKLGVENDKGLIDTWKARPYLVTRDPFNAKDGINVCAKQGHMQG